jgi:hypothetical protein
MTIWQGKLPRWKYLELTATQLTTTTDVTAPLIFGLDRDAFVFSFVNNTNAEIEIMLVNPDDPNETKCTFTRISPGFGFHSETLNAGGIFGITGGTKVYIHALGQAVTTGKFRLFIWG